MRDSGFEPLAFGFGVHPVASDALAPGVTGSHPSDNTGQGDDAASSPLAPGGTFTTPHGAPVVRNLGPRLLTVPEVAQHLSISTATLYKIVERGELPHVRVLNAIRIAPRDLAAFVEVSSKQ